MRIDSLNVRSVVGALEIEIERLLSFRGVGGRGVWWNSCAIFLWCVIVCDSNKYVTGQTFTGGVQIWTQGVAPGIPSSDLTEFLCRLVLLSIDSMEFSTDKRSSLSSTALTESIGPTGLLD